MVNIAHQAKPSAIFITRLSSKAVAMLSYKLNKWQCFKQCFIVFYTNLLNKQTGFFDKMCQQNHSVRQMHI